MAQVSARRRWDNQGFPLCLEHATGDLDSVRERPYRPAAVFLPHPRADRDSIPTRANTIPTFSLAWRGTSTDGRAAHLDKTAVGSALRLRIYFAIKFVRLVIGREEPCESRLQPRANACILGSRGASKEHPARWEVTHPVTLIAVLLSGIAGVSDANGTDLAGGSATSATIAMA